MIRIAIVDDHPALRAGLTTVLRSEPGLVPVGSAEREFDVWPLLNTTRPDVVLLDYHLPDSDGLRICRRIKSDALPPRVLVYSAYAGGDLAIPAVLAGADGVVGKGIPARELFDAIRMVARGNVVLPRIACELLEDAGRRLDTADLPILGMVMDRTPIREIAEVLGTDETAIAHRIDRMLNRLRVEVPEVQSR